MHKTKTLVLLVCLFLFNSKVLAWGYRGHRLINQQASMQLNGSFGDFLKKNKDALKWYAAVPDYIKRFYPDEKPLHFIDTDFYDEYPFENIPLNYNDLIKEYGNEKVEKMGYAPWAIEKTCDQIVYYLKNQRLDEAIFYMGILGHYVSDIHNPLHTILNYDGQLSGNKGVHFRWEVRLVEKYIKKIVPYGNMQKIDDPVLFAMDIVRESFSSHQKILEADSKARSKLTLAQQKKLSSYDILDFETPYLEKLFLHSGDLLNQRMGLSVMRTVSYWQYCWEKAGKPSLQ